MKIKKFIINHWLLIIIILLSSLLRLYKLGEYPALNADEAAIGYNAYSLIETGKDEHGNPWPIHFQSFNDYKPGGYVYVVLPFVYLFGLNEWSVRIPGALLGILTVGAVYLLVKELKIENWKFKILAPALLAISPWHIHFSRGGWEVNVATFFIVLGLYFFIKALKENKYLVLSIVFFVLSLYTYHAARVIVPLMVIGLTLIYRKSLIVKGNSKMIIGSIFFGIVITLPLLSNFFGTVGARASGVSIFSDRGYIDRINEARGRYANPNAMYVKILHNKPKEIALEFSRNYFEHFWGEFLFISGDEIQRNKVPEFGQLYIWQFPVLVLAAFAISKRSKGWAPILLWLILAPLPAALTFQSPHALRAQSMVIPLTVLSAYGLSIFSEYAQSQKIKLVKAGLYIAVLGIIGWEFSRYLHEYYVHMAKTYPYSSQYGVKELVTYVSSNQNSNVLVTSRYDQPYILFLFYTKYDPRKFQGKHTLTGRDEYGFSTVREFDRYLFKEVDFETDKLNYPGWLIAGTDQEIPDEANIIKEVNGINGVLYFQVVVN